MAWNSANLNWQIPQEHDDCTIWMGLHYGKCMMKIGTSNIDLTELLFSTHEEFYASPPRYTIVARIFENFRRFTDKV